MTFAKLTSVANLKSLIFVGRKVMRGENLTDNAESRVAKFGVSLFNGHTFP